MTDTAQTTRRPRERARSGAGTAGRKPAAKPVEPVQSVDPVGLTGERRAAGALTLTLPMITLEFRPPQVGGREVGRVVGAARALLPALPSRERLAYYGGLGALAAFGLIEWPVAAAIGVGTVIARRSRNGGGENLRAPV
ncbi:hypothetical protein [Planomonospora parontospora]|uniref:hypothetical protein n=1 Tax=Planomonospora parontospora TaxID=58119 RepID=UPI0016713623|nr:hypothetical protein [Planomonospora parontospora]GGL17670.1 hypothetical protein GCM10014719_19690 [Planomonospora parontospora subsp. antibiotica]GII15220.1 hypothetical protein Ppa05_19460 [Planomonospora parontospora subsp. antibiotica]